MDAPDLTTTLDGVGERLRATRRQRGGTLAQLSAATGISVSTLSRLESGQRRPTLELLLPIASAWRVQLDELVGAPPTGDPRIHPRPVNRHGADVHPVVAAARRAAGVQDPDPATDLDPRCLRSRRTRGTSGSTCCPAGSGCASAPRTSSSTRGEAAEFDTRTPHAIEAAGGKSAEILALFGPQGERMHVRGPAKPG